MWRMLVSAYYIKLLFNLANVSRRFSFNFVGGEGCAGTQSKTQRVWFSRSFGTTSDRLKVLVPFYLWRKKVPKVSFKIPASDLQNRATSSRIVYSLLKPGLKAEWQGKMAHYSAEAQMWVRGERWGERRRGLSLSHSHYPPRASFFALPSLLVAQRPLRRGESGSEANKLINLLSN